MLPIKIGIQLKSLKMPFKKGVAVAKELGVQAVEIDARDELRPGALSQTGVREVRRLLSDLGLAVSAVGFQTRRGYGVADELEARIQATKAAMDFARQLGTSLVINQIGRVPADPASGEWRMLIEALTDLGNYGNMAGAWLAVETGTESPADLKRLLDTLPSGSIGVNLDPGNLISNGFSPAEAVSELGRLIRHVHAKDAVHDRAQGRGVEVPLGRGAADFPYLLAALEDFGYRGYVSVERDNAQDPVFEVGQSVKFLKNLTN